MATAINTSVTWEGIESMEYFIQPMFIGKSPLETQGVRVVPNITSGQNMNYFSAVNKILKKYLKGFNAVAGSTYTQRTLTTHRMKAEMADDALDFYQTVFEQGLRTDDWNNLEGTDLQKIVLKLYRDAVNTDIYRQFWLSDTTKEVVTGGFNTGEADVDYNTYDGMWKLLYDNSSTSDTSKIYRYDVVNGAVAQVQTVTLSTDASGTANINIDGVDYLATRTTDATGTMNAFRASHAAALHVRGYVLSGTATLIVTAAKVGQPFGVITSTSVSGTAAFSIAATTANTPPAALASGESETIFLNLYQNCNKVLKQVAKNMKVLLVSDTVYENYETYLESLGTERSQVLLENGQPVLHYRGIPVISLGWDVSLDADFAHADATLPWGPHRVIYTQFDNLVLGIDSKAQFNETKMWYNPDEEENRFRQKLVMGTQYVHESLTAIAL